VPRGQRLRGAEAADAAAHHDAVRGQPRAGRGRRLGRVAGHRAEHTSPAGTRKGSWSTERWRTERRRRRGGGHGDHFRRGRLLGTGARRNGVDDATRCGRVWGDGWAHHNGLRIAFPCVIGPNGYPFPIKKMDIHSVHISSIGLSGSALFVVGHKLLGPDVSQRPIIFTYSVGRGHEPVTTDTENM
jgi:hypothetical protein